jgi:predicted transcriptional regulator
MKDTASVNCIVNSQKLEDNSIQSRLLKHIDEYPGIRYRELLRLSHLVNGVLTYHLSSLERSNQIVVSRNKSKTTRYYSRNIPAEQSQIIGCIRNEVVRRIISFILEHNNVCIFKEIVDHTGKAKSTISWHLKKLNEAGIISVQYGKHQLYKVTNREVVAEILYEYRESFVDRLVDNYTNIMEEL